MDAHIGVLREPARCGLIEMVERREGPAIQQVCFEVGKWPLNLALRLRPSRPASPRLKAVMGSERQKARVVDGLVTIVIGDHDFHVVVLLWRTALCGGSGREPRRSGRQAWIMEHNPYSESSHLI